jgi:hypothetical protein
MRYVDLKGNITITSDPKTPAVFVSYAHHDHEAAHQLLQALLEKDFVENCDNAVEAAEDQTILAAAFKAVVDGWRERKQSSRHWAPLDPRQVVRAHFVAAWRYLHGLDLDDAELRALCNGIERELLALQYVCDPDEDHPPVDH